MSQQFYKLPTNSPYRHKYLVTPLGQIVRVDRKPTDPDYYVFIRKFKTSNGSTANLAYEMAGEKFGFTETVGPLIASAYFPAEFPKNKHIIHRDGDVTNFAKDNLYLSNTRPKKGSIEVAVQYTAKEKVEYGKAAEANFHNKKNKNGVLSISSSGQKSLWSGLKACVLGLNLSTSVYNYFNDAADDGPVTKEVDGYTIMMKRKADTDNRKKKRAEKEQKLAAAEQASQNTAPEIPEPCPLQPTAEVDAQVDVQVDVAQMNVESEFMMRVKNMTTEELIEELRLRTEEANKYKTTTEQIQQLLQNIQPVTA